MGIAGIFTHQGKDYEYQGFTVCSGNSGYKKVLAVSFPKGAPAGLPALEQYCLKIIDITPGMLTPEQLAVAQGREFYDLLQFQGEHQRRILCLNDEAEQTVQQLEAGHLPSPAQCMVLEELLSPCEEVFRHPCQLTVYERLELLDQMAQGVIELQTLPNLLKKRIAAHRDLKPENMVVKRGRDSFTLRLIDYSSIRLEGETPDTATRVVIGTAPFVMSAQNTSPEGVAPRSFPPDERQDVYALGMMLASLFCAREVDGCRNPNSLWYKKVTEGTSVSEQTPLLKEAFRKALDNHGSSDDPACSSWIEQELERLGCPFEWEDTPVTPALKRLFRLSTRILPHKRVDARLFSDAVRRIMQQPQVREARSASPCLYDITPVSAYLFDRDLLDRHRADFIRQAVEQLRRDREEAQAAGQYPPSALILGWSGQDTGNRCMVMGVCDEAGMEQLVDRIPIGSRERHEPHGAHLSSTLAGLYSWLSGKKDTFPFSGRIHFFSGRCPVPVREMEAVGRITAEQLLGEGGLGSFGPPVQVTVHSCDAPAKDSGYLWQPLKQTPFTDPNRRPPPMRQKIPSPYLTGEGDACFRDALGNRYYISRKEK